MKVAVYNTKPYDKDYLEKAAAGTNHELVFLESPLKERSVKLAEGCDAVCVFVNDNLNSKIIEGLHDVGIKLIALRCAGFNNVDIVAAYQKNMKVLRVPAYSPHAVAEHAVALILTLNRKTHKAYNRVREGNFSLDRLIGFDLNGKTVGVIGTGKIGAVFAQLIKGFGCNILAYDKFENKELAGIVQYVSMDTLLNQSDIISLHCPLTPDTHNLVNAESIAKMKKGVMIINTSRGKLIDTESAINGLKTGQIGYLGIDVYEQEESIFFKDLSESIIADDKIMRLMTFPNVLITAHQAFFTDNAMVQIANTTLQNITDFETGNIKHTNEVTPEMVK